MGLLINSRQTAIAAGVATYLTGRPCKWGHVAPRRTSNKGCTACATEYQLRWGAANQDKVREHRRAYFERHHEERRLKQRADRRANPEMHRDRRIARAAEMKTWRQANRLKIVVYAHNQRAKAAEAVGRLTEADAIAAFEAAAHKCQACGSTELLEIDHVVALARGGANTRANIQILCRSCNRMKSKRDDADFKASRSASEMGAAPFAAFESGN